MAFFPGPPLALLGTSRPTSAPPPRKGLGRGGPVETIERDLTENGLVQRYATETDGINVDGVPGHEGVFLATSFWLADALHGIGRTTDAANLFTRLLSLRNDVGLLSEEYDSGSGHQL